MVNRWTGVSVADQRKLWSRANRYMILQRLIRGTSDFTTAETKVLLFIFDRTIQFRKLEESIPYHHFKFGVFHRATGEVICLGTNLGESALKPAIRRLVAKGLVRRRKNWLPFGTIYSINTKWWRREFGPVYEDILHPEDFPPYARAENQPLENAPNAQAENQPYVGWSPGEFHPTNNKEITSQEMDGTKTACANARGTLGQFAKKPFKVRPLPSQAARTRKPIIGDADFRSAPHALRARLVPKRGKGGRVSLPKLVRRVAVKLNKHPAI